MFSSSKLSTIQQHAIRSNNTSSCTITCPHCSGKSTLACFLCRELCSRGKLSYVLDGDNLRHGLNKNLGFSPEDRAENIGRVGKYASA